MGGFCAFTLLLEKKCQSGDDEPGTNPPTRLQRHRSQTNMRE